MNHTILRRLLTLHLESDRNLGQWIAPKKELIDWINITGLSVEARPSKSRIFGFMLRKTEGMPFAVQLVGFSNPIEKAFVYSQLIGPIDDLVWHRVMDPKLTFYVGLRKEIQF